MDKEEPSSKADGVSELMREDPPTRCHVEMEEERLQSSPMLEEEGPSREADSVSAAKTGNGIFVTSERHQAGLLPTTSDHAINFVVLYPSQMRFSCPDSGCRLTYTTHTSLVHHVGISHKRMNLNIRFKCAVRLRPHMLHYQHAHSVAVPPQQIDRSNEKMPILSNDIPIYPLLLHPYPGKTHGGDVRAMSSRSGAKKAVQQGESTTRTKWTQHPAAP